MDTNRTKQAARWFYGTVFRDEAIQPREEAPEEKLPSLLRAARSLENQSTGFWQSRDALFLKQARLLAQYEDDYVFNDHVTHYFPTYAALTDEELRGYFTWRTGLRKGDLRKTSLSFAFLYIYELLNQVGVESPLEGYEKLCFFRDAYGQLDEKILPYLTGWLTDYVVYYDLDADLLADSPQVRFDRSLTVLDTLPEQTGEAVMAAVKQLAPRWLSRSKFYGAHQADCDAVIVRVLAKVYDHYAKRTQKTMVEQFFGKPYEYQIRPFDSAVFCDPLRRRHFAYSLDERCHYRCENGLWTVTKHPGSPITGSKLEELLKTIDGILREEFSYGHPVKYKTQTKWLLKLIREEAQALLAEKKAREVKKLTLDYSQLARIRREAAITQDRLTVEEELEEPEPTPPQPVSEPEGLDTPLSAPEYRLLQCLLYGGSLDWVRREGHILSVLSDSINEKLYDIFLDAVVDDTPAVMEDYIEDLKEMISP